MTLSQIQREAAREYSSRRQHQFLTLLLTDSFIATNSGGILSTWLFPSNEGPNYHRATIVNIVMACVAGLFSFINILYLVRQNRDKERRKAGATADTWHLEGDRHPFYRYIY